MIAKCLTLALISIQFAARNAGQECRVTADKTNSLKCGDQVYRRSGWILDIMEKCNPGEIGTLYTQSWVNCWLTEMWLENGTRGEEGDWDFHEDFFANGDGHFELLLQMVFNCWSTGKNDPPESTEVVQCLSKGYEKICGYKTCNWVNNFE